MRRNNAGEQCDVTKLRSKQVDHDDSKTISELANDIVNVEQIIEDSIEQAQGGRVPPGFQEFWPWRFQTMSRYPDRESFVDEICELSPPDEWERICNLNGRVDDRGVVPSIIDVCTDVFRPWNGPIHDRVEMVLYDDYGRFLPANTYSESGLEFGREGRLLFPVEMPAVNRRLYSLIDTCPNLAFLLGTEYPEQIRRVAYDHWTYKVKGHISQNEGDGRRWKKRDNVYLLARCDCQDDLDGIGDSFYELRDLTPVLGIELHVTGDLDLALEDASTEVPWRNEWINSVRLRSNTTGPTNPDHVMLLVEQCKAAGVPVWDDTGISGLRELPNVD